jgi:hypothetical protein
MAAGAVSVKMSLATPVTVVMVAPQVEMEALVDRVTFSLGLGQMAAMAATGRLLVAPPVPRETAVPEPALLARQEATAPQYRVHPKTE